VPQGEVISWSGNGALLPKGSPVDLVVSNGPRPIQIPDLRGRTYADAKAILDGLGLPSNEVMVYDDTIPNGSVVNTSPGPGPVAPGSSVTVNVSQGPQIVTVPDVSGDTVAQATQALNTVGLKVGAIYGPPKATHVFGSLPAAGSHVAHGSSVDLYTDR
jgi:eukaryotic-like serine/threonine-protein kinase